MEEKTKLEKVAEIDLKTGMIKAYTPKIAQQLKHGIKAMKKEFGIRIEYKPKQKIWKK